MPEQPLLTGVGYDQPVPGQTGAEPTGQVRGGLAGQHLALHDGQQPISVATSWSARMTGRLGSAWSCS
jgi:hypothetical protein